MKPMIPLLAGVSLLWFAPAPADAPADPPAPDGQVVLFKLHAVGVQIYECNVINPNARALRFWSAPQKVVQVL